ncbi:MAG: LysR family transcriptional regulator [Alphaproteobacteria bacterium]|nr:LysR family transcriptional regulator [Alphaproteobacteria bacterium]
MDKLANMQAFAAVGQTGSFAEAARKLNLANSVVSKRVKDLEDYLQTQLFTRTTRKVSLTDNGYSYLEYVRKFLDELEEVETRLRKNTETPIGTIRLAAPLTFGVQYLGRSLARFLNEYPEVEIKTFLSDRQIDLIDEGYDLAIRAGPLKDSSLITKKLIDCRRVVCATPAYFAKHGKPETPKDLKNHNCLSYLNMADGKVWPFLVNGNRTWQAVSGNFSANNGDLLHESALSGCGITLLPTFIVGDSLVDGKLETALEDYEETDFNIYAIYQHNRHLSIKTRSLIDHLAQYFRDINAVN